MKPFVRSRTPSQPPPLNCVRIAGRDHRISLLHMEEEQYTRHRCSPSAEAHSHPIYHVVLYWRGAGEFILDDRTVTARRGTLVLTSPNQPHCFAPSSGGNLASYEMTIALEPGLEELNDWPVERLLGTIFSVELAARSFPVVVTDEQVSILMSHFEQLADALQRGGPLYWSRVDTQLAFLLADIVEIAWMKHDSAPASKDSSLREVREYIDSHYQDDMCLAELAALACLSPSQFSRRFRIAYGMPPGAYRQALRINAAKTLLTGRTWTLSEIAHHLGYRDIFAFSRMFKRHTGLSPRAFRRREINDSTIA